MVTIIHDQARRCSMTLDPVKGHSRSQGSNINISFTMYLLLQTTCDDDMSWSYDSTSVGVYSFFTDLGPFFPIHLLLYLPIHLLLYLPILLLFFPILDYHLLSFTTISLKQSIGTDNKGYQKMEKDSNV